MLWVLNGSDGNHTILDISEQSGLEFDLLREAADALLKKDLLLEKQSEKDIGL
jgi:aminopeptidase-like protein